MWQGCTKWKAVSFIQNLLYQKRFYSYLPYKISKTKDISFIFALQNLSKQLCFIHFCFTKSLESRSPRLHAIISWLPLPPPHFLQILHSPQVKVIIFWIYGCGHCWLWNIKTSHRLPDQDCRTSFRCVFLMLCTENRNMCLYLSQHVWTWKWVKKNVQCFVYKTVLILLHYNAVEYLINKVDWL